MSDIQFRQKIGLPLVSYIMIGFMIGGGVFVYTGLVYQYSAQALPLAYFFAAIPVFISMMPLAMLASAMPISGANYMYASRMVSPGLAFTGVWVYALASFFGQIPLYLIGCSRYIESLAPEVNVTVLALVILTIFYLINLLGVKMAAQFQGILILVLITALVVFISGGIDTVEVSRFHPLLETGSGGLILGVALLSFTYFGGNGVVELGSEIKNPGKTIPRAFYIAFPLVMLLYVGLSFVTVGSVPGEMLQDAPEPLLVAGKSFLGNGFYVFFVVGGAVLALLTTLNSLLIIGTRSLFMIVQDQMLPAWMGRLTPGKQVPWVLLTLIYALSVAGILSGFSLNTFASYASLGGLVIFVPILLAAWRFPTQYPKQFNARPFRISRFWLRAAVLVGLAMVLFFGVIILYDLKNPFKILFFLMFIATGYLVFCWRKQRLTRLGKPLDSLIKKLDVDE
ncbi:MAG: APC family permease [Bacteroidales bacterium]|nr:APC family permease [Bacteroidales bacterium]